jgi:AcrR family transcriptional regulator
METAVKLKRGDLREALIIYTREAARQGHIEVMSLRKAARDLGVSSGAVYRHFADKDALLVEIATMAGLELRAAFHTIRPEDAPATSIDQCVERSFSFVRTYIYFAHENPALWRMMFGRIGRLVREEAMKCPEHMHYTTFDAAIQNHLDLYRLGGLDREPTMEDHRYVWSAVHGAADLAQSGARFDAGQLDEICAGTTLRNLRALGLKIEALPDSLLSPAP